MIWEVVLRGGALVALAEGALALADRVFSEEVLPHKIYGTTEAARLLGMERAAVLVLVRSDKIKAKMIGGNYRILGASILEYISR